MTSRILVVDDDTALAEMIGIVLRTEGFEPVFCADGAVAVDAWRSEKPDLVLLDLMLPGMDGIEICTRIRAESGCRSSCSRRGPTPPTSSAGSNRAPTTTSSSRSTQGARRTHPHAAAPGRGDGERDAARGRRRRGCRRARSARRGDVAIALTPLEFELLVALASKPQQVFSREMLLEQVWGYHYKADTRLVNVHVQRLRAKVEIDPDNPKIVMTVRGVGYRAGAVV
jgi:two-component system response regulator MtrA